MSDSAQALGTAERPLRVAIIGSGPSGFYAAAALLKSQLKVEVHMFERFPTPFGLVRYGVAPDHAKIRNVIKTYHQTAQQANFRFWGNVEIGKGLNVEELRRHFDAVIYAFGAKSDRKLNIPGEDLRGSYTATEFCAWYNAHPEYRHCTFDLSADTAVVVGVGNVAMDVTRMLAKPIDELVKTDIAAHAVELLRGSKVKDIYCIGRRGPAQTKFTPKEIKELGEIPGCDVIVDPKDLELNPESEQELKMPGNESNVRNMEILREFAKRAPTGAGRRIVLKFFLSPTQLIGKDRVEAVELERNVLKGEPGNQWAEGTGEKFTLACGILFRSVGYRGIAIAGIPFDEKKGIIPNTDGRVKPGEYVVGWIKRGPSGLIGTNKKDSEDTVSKLLEDAAKLPGAAQTPEQLRELLKQRGGRVTSYQDWLKIDAAEVERGQKAGKPRENFSRVDEMLAVLDTYK